MARRTSSISILDFYSSACRRRKEHLVRKGASPGAAPGLLARRRTNRLPRMVNWFIKTAVPLLPPRYEKIEALARRFPVIDAPTLDSAIWLFKTASALSESFDEHYARHGLSRGRFHVLVLLYQSEAGGLSPAELAEQCGVTRAAMTGLIDALVEAEMVAREDEKSDRRTYRVRLTEKAFRFLATFLPVQLRRMARVLADLSPEERRQLRKLLEKVAGRIDGLDEPGPAEATRHAPRR
jgi:DNA-binding MarR family transcriptional regulator